MRRNMPVNPKRLRFGALFWVIRKEYFEIMHDASQAFDKIIMTLSTFSLGFTFGLVSYKSVVNLPCLAMFASLLFICSIASSLYSLWLRQDYGVKAMIDWNAVYKIDMEYERNTPQKAKQFESPMASRMVNAQAFSGVFFIIALLLLLIFVSCNLFF